MCYRRHFTLLPGQKQTMSDFRRILEDSLELPLEYARGFWNWWTRELWDLTPKSFRQVIWPDTAPTVFSIDDLISDDSIPVQTSTNDSEAVLAIPAHHILIQRFKLPALSRSSLRQAVELDMDRRSPIPPRDVYFSISTSVSNAPDTCQVTLKLVRKLIIDKSIERLKEAGWRIRTINQVDETGSISKLQFANISRTLRPWTLGLNFALVLACFGLAVSNIAVSHWTQTAKREAIRAEISILRPEVIRAAAIRNTIESVQKRNLFLLNEKNKWALSRSLGSIATVLGEDGWLTEIRLQDEKLTLTGLTKENTNLVEAFERVPAFQNAKWTGPRRNQPGTEYSLYSLSLELGSGE